MAFNIEQGYLLIGAITSDYYLVVTYILAGILGLCIGSFLNVVIYRVPLKMSLAKPNSHCPKCGYELKWYDNIPVLSYIILGGKCRSCKEHISFRYTIVEIANAVLYVLCVLLFHNNFIYMLLSMAVCSIGLSVAFIDIENMIIPDRFQIMLLVLGIISIFCDNSSFGAALNIKWYSHLIGGACGFLVLLLIAFLGEKILKREALGGGDIKLAGVCGLILGWEKLILAMLIASILGSIVMVIKAKKSKESKETPFGQFIMLGVLISLFLGNIILNFYVNTFIL